MSETSLISDKARLRRDAMEARALHSESQAHAAGLALGEIFLERIPRAPGACVTGFWPSRNEIDIKPLLHSLDTLGHPVGLPVILGKGQALAFRRWRPGLELVPGNFRIPVPPEDCPAVTPDILLVPLLAFDSLGYRLGYGGGFYDRTLAELRERRAILAVGVGFASQEVQTVPHLDYDQRLDFVVTERACLATGG